MISTLHGNTTFAYADDMAIVMQNQIGIATKPC